MFPRKNYGSGEHCLIALTHQDAVGVIERTVDWFLDLRAHAPPVSPSRREYFRWMHGF